MRITSDAYLKAFLMSHLIDLYYSLFVISKAAGLIMTVAPCYV